jgi:hypothetical protein
VGDGCDSCLVPRNLWTNKEKIKEGFVMDRTLGKFNFNYIFGNDIFLVQKMSDPPGRTWRRRRQER